MRVVVTSMMLVESSLTNQHPSYLPDELNHAFCFQLLCSISAKGWKYWCRLPEYSLTKILMVILLTLCDLDNAVACEKRYELFDRYREVMRPLVYKYRR